VIGTVQGDLHDIGKNLVAALLQGGGFEVHDLGVDVPATRFVAAVGRYSPDIIALSALLTITLPSMKSTLVALGRGGVRGRVRVMVGGAPVTRQYTEQIGADGYSDNAFGAVRLAARRRVAVGPNRGAVRSGRAHDCRRGHRLWIRQHSHATGPSKDAAGSAGGGGAGDERGAQPGGFRARRGGAFQGLSL